MPLWSRLRNVFRGDRLSREIDEEIQSHIEEAIEQGRDPAEARRMFGSALRTREASRDVRLIPWLDSLRADTVFGWRQLRKRKATSAAAILSLALGIGACTAAFRLIDALLLRPLPVAHADRLYAAVRRGVGFDGKMETGDSWAYPSFVQMRAAVKDQAELLAVSQTERTDVTYRSDQDMEKAYLQYVSGGMFGAFGLRPAAGRLLTGNDDRKPGAHPVAVLSYDYWSRRFGRDPNVVGRTLHLGGRLYDIAGVVEPPFTGTESGTVADIFVPTMMHPGATHDDWTWHRTLVILKPGAILEPVRAKLHATSRAFEEERAKGFTGMSRESIEQFLAQQVLLEPAAAGVSGLQREYKPALEALAVLVALMLLIACANVANLLTAQAAARAREMALRVSIGAGRGRLVQMVLLESALIALAATGLGALFAGWAAPFVVSRVNPPDNPAQLALPADWRLLGFSLALTIGVTLLFGLAPALRASSVQPAGVLKGGADPHARRRSMHALIGMQTALCFVVLFLSGLFVTSFDRLSHRPRGYSAERLLNLETVSQKAQPVVFWAQVADHLNQFSGVRSVALAGWPLLAGGAWNGFVSVNGAPPGPVLAYFLSVSPGWVDTMRIPWVEGRDFRETDSTPGAAIVNEAFVRQFLEGRRAIGTSFSKGDLRFTVVGVVRNAPYRDLREPDIPVAYVPFRSVDAKGVPGEAGSATLVVRTSGENLLAMAPTLRREVPLARPGFRVSNIRTQQEIDDAHTVRERLLAMLARFFAIVSLLLAAVGLYGVLDYSVLQRRKEIGIRIAIGAPAGNIARLVTAEISVMVLVGALAGLGLGRAAVQYIAPLLYEVRPTDPAMLAAPSLVLLAALLAAVPGMIRAIRIDPSANLRSE